MQWRTGSIRERLVFVVGMLAAVVLLTPGPAAAATQNSAALAREVVLPAPILDPFGLGMIFVRVRPASAVVGSVAAVSRPVPAPAPVVDIPPRPQARSPFVPPRRPPARQPGPPPWAQN